MKRLVQTTILTALLALAWFSSHAQQQFRLHLQSHTYGEMHALGQDTLLLPIYKSRDFRMAVITADSAYWAVRSDSALPQNPRQLAMADNRNGIAAANNGDLMLTQNGWRTAEIIPGGASVVHRHATGYIAGRYNGGRYRFHHSTDGRTWTMSNPDLRTDEGYSTWDKYVFTGSLSSPWYSTDGAQTFTSLTRSTVPNFGQVRSYQLIGADTLMVVATNGLFVSTDLGLTYTQHTLTALPRTGNIQWVNSKLGAYYVQTPAQTVSFTTDGGQTWTTPATVPFTSVGGLFRHGRYWYVRDDDQQFWRTADNGATFEVFLPGYASRFNGIINEVEFQGRFGVSVGEDGHVSVSNSGGRYFVVRTAPTTEDLFAVGIAPNGKIYAGDRKGQVWASADRGLTWQNKLSQNIQNLIAYKFFFSNDSRITVMQRAGQPVVSTDTGRTFNFVAGFGGNHVFALKPASGQMIGAAKEGNGLGPKSEVYWVDPANGQRTRLVLINTDDLNPVALHMVNDNVGYYIAGNTPISQYHVFRTTDGWQSYTEMTPIPLSTSPLNANNIAVQDFGPQTLFVHEKPFKAYLKTTDGGQTWEKVVLNVVIDGITNIEMNRPYFFAPDKYIYPMNNRMFLLNAFSDGSAPYTAVQPRLGHAAQRLGLYPNPARDEVRFDLSFRDLSAQALVFDMAGRRLIAADASAGRISTASLRPGLYQLVLVRNGRVEARGAFVRE